MTPWLLALAYLPALLRIAPVRVIDPRRLVLGVLDGAWARYSSLLGAPIRAGDQRRLHLARPPDLGPEGHRHQEGSTANVRNVPIERLRSLGRAIHFALPDGTRWMRTAAQGSAGFYR
jgi:hypothetical protein